MGLDYKFLVVMPVNRVDALPESIAAHLDSEDKARLRASLPWSPYVDRVSDWLGEPPARDRRGISKLRPRPDEVGDSYCFTFLFKRDEALTEYERSNSSIPRPEGKLVAIGCIWCSLRAGDEWAVFRATAATSDMSLLFKRSPSVRSLWSTLAREAGATALFFDVEDIEHWELLYPSVGQVTKPDEELYELEDRIHVNVDGYFADALRKAGISSSGNHSPAA